jgi:hypothetical protein
MYCTGKGLKSSLLEFVQAKSDNVECRMMRVLRYMGGGRKKLKYPSHTFTKL